MLLVFVLALVNLPLAHETWVDHRITTQGRETRAQVFGARSVRGQYFVNYRLSRAIDPARTSWSARLDPDSYRLAQQNRDLAVRYVPGHPEQNRPVGEATTNLLWVVTPFADVVLLLLIAMIWYRRRIFRGLLVHTTDVAEGTVTLDLAGLQVEALAPPGWLDGVRQGQRVNGSVHLVAGRDVNPSTPGEALRQIGAAGAEYVVHGRVSNVAPRRITLLLDAPESTYPLHVEFGEVRVRADLREYAETEGILHFTPSRFTPPR